MRLALLIIQICAVIVTAFASVDAVADYIERRF